MIDNNLYYFECSHMQLFQDFVRFGKDAFVIRPEQLRGRIKRFYIGGVKSYGKTDKP